MYTHKEVNEIVEAIAKLSFYNGRDKKDGQYEYPEFEDWQREVLPGMMKEANPLKWGVGRKVRVTNRQNGHGFLIGQVVRVENPKRFENDECTYWVCQKDGVKYILFESEGEVIE